MTGPEGDGKRGKGIAPCKLNNERTRSTRRTNESFRKLSEDSEMKGLINSILKLGKVSMK